MSVMELFEVLKNNQMSIGLADGKLKVADPHQKLTPALRDQIRHSKDELMRVLSKRDSFVVSDFAQATMSDTQFQEIKQAYPDLQDLYVASPLQKGMFFHETFAGSETCYSRQIYFDMDGRVDGEALRQAWHTVIGRHAIFRTCFVGFDTNEIHQLVAKQSEIAFETIEQPAGLADLDGWLDQFHVAQRAARFDYGRPALMRLALIKLSEQRSHFACTYHHAILDGWSIPLLLDEVNQCYQAILEGGQAMLPSSVPYAHYIGWLASQDQDVALGYWTDYLAGYAPPKRPQFAAAPGAAPHRGGGCRLAIDPALGAQLVAYCAAQRCTMSAMLHLAWASTLGRYLNQDDIVVGSVSSVRPADIAHVERMLGLLVNTVPVRVRFDAALTVKQGLDALARHNADSADYRYFALDKMQAALGFSNKLPLFESLLVFQNYPDFGKGDGDELTKNVTLANAGYAETNTFALLLNGSLVGERLSLELAYDERVTPALAQHLADYLHLTLKRIVQAAPESALLALDGAAQPAQGIDGARGGERVKVADLVDAQAIDNPRKPAVTHDFVTWNYQQLVEKANRLANYLIGAGVRRNDVVAIMLDRSLDLVAAMLAVAKAGAAYLLLDASEPDDRIGYKLSESGASFILSDEQGEDRFTLAAATKIIIDAAKVAKEIARSAVATPIPKMGPHSEGAPLAYVNFVSHPSGYPAKVCVTQQMLATLVAWHNGRAVAQQDKQVLCGSSVLLERCSLEVLAALCEGAQVALANNVLDLCINPTMQPTTMSLASDDLTRLFGRAYAFEGVRGVTLYDALPCPQQLKRLLDCGIESVDLYLSHPAHGVVAGVCRVTRDTLDQPARFEGIAGVSRLAVHDLFGRSQPVGALGQLHIAGQAQVHASGYTARMDSDGAIALLEQSAEQVDIGGYRCAFAEIEAHINGIDEVSSCAVMMRDDDQSGARLAAYLVYKSGFTGSPNNYAEDSQYFEEVHHCKKYLLGKLPVLLVPETYVFLDQLPRLANGMLDRASLPSPDEVSNERRNFVRPTTPIEEALVVLWEGSFLLNDISCSDDFFELGGSSLLQVKLGARINKDFGTSLPLNELFRDTTSISSQAEVIRLAIEAQA
jgi:non-ribosomal peptide synthetase component F